MKYLGSKARLVKDILPIMLSYRTTEEYVEPFAGGMNVICEVSNPRLANDVDPYLIKMWEFLLLGWIPEEVTRELYQDIRANPGNYPDYLVGWVAYNCSYAGKWFGGYAGRTKTKDGTRNYQAEAIKNVKKQIRKMNGIKLSHVSYRDVSYREGSIIYCDPPYRGVTGYSCKFDHDQFWNWARDMSRKHKVFVSEYEAPNDFKCIWQKEVKSSLSANGSYGGSLSSMEKLFILNS